MSPDAGHPSSTISPEEVTVALAGAAKYAVDCSVENCRHKKPTTPPQIDVAKILAEFQALKDKVAALEHLAASGKLNGKDGERGQPGDKGPQGIAGQPGKDGRDGAPGSAGKDGAPGRNGTDGKNADETKVIAAVTEWVKQNRDLFRGDKGEKGTDGRSTSIDDVARYLSDNADRFRGRAGDMGVAGPAGPQGPIGRDGRDGQSGRTPDLAEIAGKVIEEMKRFPDLFRGQTGKDGSAGTPGKNGAVNVVIKRLDGTTKRFDNLSGGTIEIDLKKEVVSRAASIDQ